MKRTIPATQFTDSDDETEQQQPSTSTSTTDASTLKSPAKKQNTQPTAPQPPPPPPITFNDNDAIDAEEDALSTTLKCAICRGLMHQPTSVLPCLHTFCGGCISAWTKSNPSCPACRRPAEKLGRNRQVADVIDVLVVAKPHLKRSESDMRDVESRNVVQSSGEVVVAAVGTQPDYDHDDDDNDNDEEDEYEDDEPQVCLHCPPNAAPDGYSCPEGDTVHTNCARCYRLMPERNLETQRCKYCNVHSCHVYYQSEGGCPSNFGWFQRLRDFTFTDVPYTAFSNNNYERQILADILHSNSIPLSAVLQSGITRLDNATETLTTSQYVTPHAQAGIVVSGDDYACMNCATGLFGEFCYWYRRDLEADKIPAAVSGREDCWYGRECRTQRHNASHATRLNHVCENKRRH